jgi:hypothetical protein
VCSHQNLPAGGHGAETTSITETVTSGDAAQIVRRMKEESDVPIRSHGSLSLNRALMAS